MQNFGTVWQTPLQPRKRTAMIHHAVAKQGRRTSTLYYSSRKCTL